MLKRGDRVRITEGPYAGRVGRVVETYDRQDRTGVYAAHLEFEVRAQDTSFDTRMLTVFASQLEVLK